MKIIQNFFNKFKAKFGLKNFAFFVFGCISAFLIILQFSKNIEAKDILKFNRDPKNYNVKLQVIDEKEQEIAKFFVAIANSKPKQAYGLMNLENLPQKQGMIFEFEEAKIISMWMKNTLISLDMVFIDENNLISHVKTNAKPYSLEIISSQKPAKKVLEINAGLAEKFGIKVGQKIILKSK
jgi:uncharacterized membrane protein (UPF0127 family)